MHDFICKHCLEVFKGVEAAHHLSVHLMQKHKGVIKPTAPASQFPELVDDIPSISDHLSDAEAENTGCLCTPIYDKDNHPVGWDSRKCPIHQVSDPGWNDRKIANPDVLWDEELPGNPLKPQPIPIERKANAMHLRDVAMNQIGEWIGQDLKAVYFRDMHGDNAYFYVNGKKFRITMAEVD